MAQLKDSLITGDLRVTGKIYGLGTGLTNIDASQITSGTLPVERGGTGQTSIANIQAGKDSSGNTITSTYVKKAGDTMTGALNFANNVYNKMGDDCQIGDQNQAGKIAIKGINGATGIYFAPYSGSTAQTLSIDGAGTATMTNNLTIGSNLRANGGFITLYREGTTANNYPAGIKFSLKDTTTSQTYEGAYLYAYQDHQATTYGANVVLNTGGGLFIGSGESPGSHYSAKGASYAGEDTFITADGTAYIQANGNTIANRLGFAVNASHEILPVKADAATNNTGSLGTTTYRWYGLYANRINNLLTGTGTAASDGGASASPNRYKPAKWTFNLGAINPKDGDMFTIKIPVAGHDYGTYMSIDNGTTYYPLVLTDAGRLTTHYAVGRYIQVVFEAAGTANSMFAINGSDSRATVSGGVFRVLNYYDTNTDVRPASYCVTAAGTAAKVASHSAYVLKANSYTLVTIQNANTSASALTLNINSTGAKPIYINGSASSASNYTLPAGTYIVFYNGTNYYFRTDAGIQGGTWFGNASTASKLATARSLKTKLDSTTAVTFDGSAAQDAIPVTGTLPVGNGGTGNTTGTATYATTTADTTNDLLLVGVTSGATTTLKRNSGVWMKNGSLFTNSQLQAGLSTTAAETQVKVQSVAGLMYMYAQASATGNRGIYVGAHGTGSATGILTIDTNNVATLNGRATQDGNGNNIVNTYIKHTSEDTVTKQVRVLTQSAYDAITTKSNDTIYFTYAG